MAVRLNEPIVTELKSRLDSNLAAEVTAINAGVTDGFTIENPTQVLTFVPPPGLLTMFPTIGIGDAPSRFEDDVGHSATGHHELIVVGYLQDSDQEALTWRLRRYAQAIARVVLDDRNLGTAAWGTGLVSVDPGPTLADDPEDPQVWMSWVGVRIWANRDEE